MQSLILNLHSYLDFLFNKIKLSKKIVIFDIFFAENTSTKFFCLILINIPIFKKLAIKKNNSLTFKTAQMTQNSNAN